jgi:hypothetical protein
MTKRTTMKKVCGMESDYRIASTREWYRMTRRLRDERNESFEKENYLQYVFEVTDVHYFLGSIPADVRTGRRIVDHDVK